MFFLCRLRWRKRIQMRSPWKWWLRRWWMSQSLKQRLNQRRSLLVLC